MLRPGERLLAGQQAEEGGGLHRAGQGGLVDAAVQRNLGGAEGSAVEMGDEGIAFEDEGVLFRSQREGLAAALAFQPRRTGDQVAVWGVVEDSRDRWIRGLSRYGAPADGQKVAQLPHSLQASAMLTIW